MLRLCSYAQILCLFSFYSSPLTHLISLRVQRCWPVLLGYYQTLQTRMTTQASTLQGARYGPVVCPRIQRTPPCLEQYYNILKYQHITILRYNKITYLNTILQYNKQYNTILLYYNIAEYEYYSVDILQYQYIKKIQYHNITILQYYNITTSQYFNIDIYYNFTI